MHQASSHSIRLFAFLLFLPLFSYAVDVSSCFDASSNNYYELTQNITGNKTGGYCINANNTVNVTINCAGHTITGNTAATTGILMSYSPGSRVENCIIKNYSVGLAFDYSNASTASNNSVNGTGSGTCVRVAYSNNADIRNNTASSCFYCFGSYPSTGSNFTNNTAYTCMEGFDIFTASTGNIFRGNTVQGPWTYDAFRIAGSSNTFTSNTLRDMITNGFYLTGAPNNTFDLNDVSNSSRGFYIANSNGTSLAGNDVYGNGVAGTYVFRSSSTVIANDHYFGNGRDVLVNNTLASNVTINLSRVIFSPAAGLTSFTNLSISDQVAPNSSYMISWTANSSEVPPGRTSFSQKFVNITKFSGNVSIDRISWLWRPDDVGGRNESQFELWKYNSTHNWTMLNDTPDTDAHVLSLNNMGPGSIYGILENGTVATVCPVISAPGTSYVQSSGLSGAPNSVSGGSACVVVTADDVTYDCNGYSVTGPGTFGIYATGANFVLKNCPDISDYTFGIFLNGVEVASISDTTLRRSSGAGIHIGLSQNVNLTRIALTNNSDGIRLESSNHTLILNTTVNDSTGTGLRINTSRNVTIDRTMLTDNGNGIGINSSNNILVRQTSIDFSSGTALSLEDTTGAHVSDLVIENAGTGIELVTSSSNTFESVHASSSGDALHATSGGNAFNNLSLHSDSGSYISATSAPNNYTQLTLNKGNTQVYYGGTLTVSESLHSGNAILGTDFVSIDSAEYDAPAEVTTSTDTCVNPKIYSLTGLPTSRSDIIIGGTECLTCSILDCNDTMIRFTVPGFTGYAATGLNATLVIFDENDPEGGAMNRMPGDNVIFFANYSNATSGQPINSSAGSCNVSFSEAPSGPSAMAFNSSSGLWEYNRQINGTSITWSAICAAAGFETLNASDTLDMYLNANLNGANITNITRYGRYNGTAAGNISSEGGNISGVNINSSQLTGRWAAYFGNVTGSIVLRGASDANYVYSWAWTPADGGVICLSTNSSLSSFLATPALGSDIDAAWAFSNVSDSGANTFTGSNCSLAIGASTIPNASYADTGPAGGFMTCAVKSAATPAKPQMMFCTGIISGGAAWNSDLVDFEVLVPTNDTPGSTETYYFYANLD